VAGDTMTGALGIGGDADTVGSTGRKNLVLASTGNTGMTIKAGAAHSAAINFTDTDATNQGLIAYTTDTDEMVFFTNGTQKAGIDSSGNFKMNSGYGSVATAYGCRAWVNFNGTGTVAIRASGNVSSITDQGTGLYVVNLATAMPDANYSVFAFAYKVADNSGNYRGIATGYRSPSTTSFGVHTGTAQIDDVQDFPIVTAAVFR
jgi:hypothetical protein